MKKIVLGVATVLVVLIAASVAMAAKPGSQVRGQGKVQIGDPATTSVSHISVNAWADSDGVAHGTVEWTGGVGPNVPPPVPWHTDVTSIDISGNTAEVCFVVVHSVFPADIGITSCLDFTDNAATNAPDEIEGAPIQGGNIIVR